MSDKDNNRDNVIDAEKRFDQKGGFKTDKQREQDREYGETALKALKECTKLPQNDREQIARRLGFHIRIFKVDSSLLAKRSGFEPKELYRLTLKQGQEVAQYRLRPTGRKYAALIETLCKLVHPRIDVFTLTSKITRGTSVHPSGTVANSETGKLINLIYLLADGIDDKFRLSEKFATIAQMKKSLDRNDQWAYWPSYKTPEELAWSQKHNPTGISNTSFWLPSLSKQTEKGILAFEFDNIHWEQVIGYLPHFFLGHQRNFAWDHDYWPAPEEDMTEEQDNEWREQVQNDMFKVLDNNPEITTDWDTKTDQLLFNQTSVMAYRKRMYDFNQRTRFTNCPGNWDENEDVSGIDTPGLFWLCIYPNIDATGVVPVLISTNWFFGDGCSIELLDEQLMEDIADYPVLGEGTLSSRLRQALLVPSATQEPRIMTEWIRTSPFIERHPLRRKYQEYLASERLIKKWHKEILKNAPSNNQQESKS